MLEYKLNVERFNNYLQRDFGYFDGIHANYRIVYSDNEKEKRFVTHTREGLEYIRPRIEEVPKYKQWIHNKFVLEKMTFIPNDQQTDLLGNLSYEPVWVFQDKDGNFLPPNYDVAKLVIASMNEAMAWRYGVKYKDERSMADFKEVHEEHIKELQKELFANETKVGDALAIGSGVSITSDDMREK